MNSELIGAKLRKLRGRQPREQVAEACGISLSAIMMYKNGKRIPKDDIKIALARYYGTSVEVIFFEGQCLDM